jgi:hypothetical protein
LKSNYILVIVLLLFLTGIVEKSFTVFGVVDALGGIWALLAYQKERKGD